MNDQKILLHSYENYHDACIILGSSYYLSLSAQFFSVALRVGLQHVSSSLGQSGDWDIGLGIAQLFLVALVVCRDLGCGVCMGHSGLVVASKSVCAVGPAGPRTLSRTLALPRTRVDDIAVLRVLITC